MTSALYVANALLLTFLRRLSAKRLLQPASSVLEVSIDQAQVLNNLYPDLSNVPKGDVSQREKLFADSNVFDGRKCARVLGIKYTDMDTTFGDMARCLKEKFRS
jgi:hypothetical protein